MRALMRVWVGLLGLGMMAITYAAGNPAIGLWETVDADGQPTSHVTTYIQNGQLTGKIERMLPNAAGQVPTVCTQCSDERQNQPLKGMIVLWGFTPEGNQWSNGQVLAPKTGKIYDDVTIAPATDGQSLRVTIHSGFFSKVQVWKKVSQ